MKFKFMQKAGVLAVAVCLALSAMPVFGADSNSIEVVLEDITETETTTLAGESKVKVSVKNAEGQVSIAQIPLTFGDGLKYKSIEFLKGENNPPSCILVSPNVAKANQDKSLMPSIIATNELDFANDEALFIVTFEGSGNVSLGDLSDTYCKVVGTKYYAAQTAQASLTAATSGAAGKNAQIRLQMDKVSFVGGGSSTGYNDSGVDVKITSETNEKFVIYTVLNNILVSKGGHRENTSAPSFLIENTVLADHRYTVEISGLGYVPYKATGVTFDSVLTVTNADFKPGDCNMDGTVDASDKEICQNAITNSSEIDDMLLVDFNRDGNVDADDLRVFDGIVDSETDDGGSAGGGSSSSGGSTGENTGGGAIYPTTPEKTETFTDLENYGWAKDAIYTLKDKGIISGTSETEYAPSNNIKRGDFILILSRMLKLDNAFTENFADVPQDSYYYNAIGAAKAAGIASGDGTSFMPEASITRQDLITLAYRAFLAKGYIEETSDYTVLDAFADKDNISDYATAPMASMVKTGIIQGSDDGSVNPKGNATRAEVAVMCARLCELMK